MQIMTWNFGSNVADQTSWEYWKVFITENKIDTFETFDPKPILSLYEQI